jgi:SAM-dependent methyltransferase
MKGAFYMTTIQPDDKPLALDAYEALADHYAAKIDTKPHNAYYDRPATLALLPDVDGRRVLDAGCGPGVYAEWLLDHGAEVVAVDVSPKMVAFARARVGDRCEVRHADLGQPLDFLADESFDLVLSPLVLSYLADWHGPFREFHRILRPAGWFVFSTGHPFFEHLLFDDARYFEIERRQWPWRGFGGEPVIMPFYRRPLSAITGALWDTGFVIERLVEPLPTEDFKQADPEDYEKLLRMPGFMHIRARKDGDR